MTRVFSYSFDLRFYGQTLFLSVMCWLALSFNTVATAQTSGPARIDPPDFTTTSILKDIEALEAEEELTEEQKANAKDWLESAVEALSSAAKNLETQTRYRTELNNASQTLQTLRESIEIAQNELTTQPTQSDEPMREEALIQLEQDLVTKEGTLRTLRTELEGYDTGLQTLSARQVSAPTELNDSRTKLGERTTELAALGDGVLDSVGEARRKSLEARIYSRRAQVSALEQETAGLSQRQEIVTARRNLADIKQQRLAAEVQYLQEKTGQRRFNDASKIKTEAETLKETYQNAHPLVIQMAEDNIALSQQIVDLASGASSISKLTANARSRLDIVQSDLRVAEDLIALGNLDRQAGATLRRLSNQLQSPDLIRNQIAVTQKSLVNVTQRRLIAQENLRDMSVGRTDAIVELAKARNLNPELPSFIDTDQVAISVLQNNRRDLLRRITNATSSRINETVDLQGQQTALLTTTQDLKVLLDEKLLWIPSVPAIDFGWPAKVVRGALVILSPENMSLTLQVLLEQVTSYWYIVFAFGAIIALCVGFRGRLWEDVTSRAKLIGRVQDDSYWHTPNVILACVMIALPFPLFFFFLYALFGLSNSPEPLVDSLSSTFFYLAFFALFFLTWRAWDRDKSLFGAHYKLPDALRSRMNKQLRWFIPVAGISIAMINLTVDSPDTNVYEGFSLFAFIVTALTLFIFGYKVLWERRNVLRTHFDAESSFQKYRGIITFIIVGLPLLASGFAAFGYYDTGLELLGRMFFSGWLFLLTYVVYGLIKRTILVAQRQLALTQAIEKRDAAIKAREEKAAAEERGEDMPPPPPLDTSEIDIKAMTRQSAQLLNTLIVLGFAALMWIIWSDLLPALSIFNEVKIGSYTGRIADEAGAMLDVSVPITLWDLMQSFVILGLTFIAAKNLPGFLEIFVLSRAGVDPGTRYAVKTILGYMIVAIGIVIGFDRLGLQWSQLRWIVTGLSVGIGFGLQKIIANFISGLIILFERPVRIGDYVTIGEQSGTVSRIQIRATTLNDLDNREILIPNEALISERVTNWTLSNSVTRLTVPVGIAYGSDTDVARDLMLDALRVNPKVLDTPAPQVLFTGFGASSLDFELRVFLRNFDDRIPVRHTIHTDINKVLAKAGISIPFPQTDLNIVSQSVPIEVAQHFKNKPKKS